MATGSLTIVGNVSGGADGARTFGPITVTFSAAVDETLPVALSSGNNTITVPAGSTTAVLLPPNMTTPGVSAPNPSYGGTLTLKGVTGDTGTPMSLKNPQVLCWDTAPASIVVNASVSGTMTAWFA